jgi:hypothetical protein
MKSIGMSIRPGMMPVSAGVPTIKVKAQAGNLDGGIATRNATTNAERNLREILKADARTHIGRLARNW